MAFTLDYAVPGRGSWNNTGRGGTLGLDGAGSGPFYRSPATPMPMTGTTGSRALAAGDTCHINDYATFMAVKAIQNELGMLKDGKFGSMTGAAVKRFQESKGLVADGIYGPVSGREMFRPVALRAARDVSTDVRLTEMVMGHVGWESGWDPGAVGGTTPQDLGLGQINGPAHKDMSVEVRLDPRQALPWVARFIQSNLAAMNNVERDGIAAYNLGVGGARDWVTLGRPRMYKNRDVWHYIEMVLAAAA